MKTLPTPGDFARESAARLGVSVGERAPGESKDLHARVLRRFAPERHRWPFWGALTGPARRGRFAFRHLHDFSRDRVLLLFNDHEEPIVFSFANTSDLVSVLDDMPGVEVCVTDDDLSFLLCFNHHDYLIAEGTAISWLTLRHHCTDRCRETEATS